MNSTANRQLRNFKRWCSVFFFLFLSFFHSPWIRICGWRGTGAGRRVFLPGLGGGQACVRWLGWGTVEGRERRGWELAGGCFLVRNCSIVTALLSCFFFSFLFNFLFIVPLPFRLGNPKAPHQNEEFVYHLFKTLSTVLYLCVPEEMVSSVRVCFINEEQLSNQSTLFSLAPLGSNRKYSQDFLSLSQALKQDTSARPASKVWACLSTLGVCRFANNKK